MVTACVASGRPIRQERAEERGGAYGRGPRRRGRASGRDPKGGAVEPAGCVKPLARCPRIARRGFPALPVRQRRADHDHGEKSGLGYRHRCGYLGVRPTGCQANGRAGCRRLFGRAAGAYKGRGRPAAIRFGGIREQSPPRAAQAGSTMPVENLYLVLGGARSGKSHHAEALVEAAPQPWRYIATA